MKGFLSSVFRLVFIAFIVFIVFRHMIRPVKMQVKVCEKQLVDTKRQPVDTQKQLLDTERQPVDT